MQTQSNLGRQQPGPQGRNETNGTQGLERKAPRPLCTHEEIYNHQTVYINSDDFSNSPSFLKMSLENTPALQKRRDSSKQATGLRSSQDIPLHTLHKNSLMLAKLLNSPFLLENTLKKFNLAYDTPPTSTDRKKSRQNKENIEEKPTSINWQNYSVNNLIQIVDGMYERAVDRKIRYNVDIEMCKNGQGIEPRLLGLTDNAETSRKSVRIQIEKLRLMQRCRERFNRSNSSHETEEACCQIINEEEKEDRCLSTTQRVSIEMLPESNENEYMCKEEEELEQKEEEEEEEEEELVEERKLELQPEQEQLCTELYNLEVSQQYVNTNSNESEGSQAVRPKIKYINIKDMQERSASLLLNPSIQLPATAGPKCPELNKLKTYNSSTIAEKKVLEGKPKPNDSEGKAMEPLTDRQNRNKNPGSYKGVYEEILSEYSTAKLLAISREQYKNSVAVGGSNGKVKGNKSGVFTGNERPAYGSKQKQKEGKRNYSQERSSSKPDPKIARSNSKVNAIRYKNSEPENTKLPLFFLNNQFRNPVLHKNWNRP